MFTSCRVSEHFYTGITGDLKAKLSKHSSGAVTHTAKYRPWRIKSYVVFSSGSGTGLKSLVRMARLLWGLAALVRGL